MADRNSLNCTLQSDGTSLCAGKKQAALLAFANSMIEWFRMCVIEFDFVWDASYSIL